MEINSVQGGKEIIERFKKSLDIKKDVELAEILGVLPSTISTWKRRNSLNHALLIELSKLHKIDLNYLFFGNFSAPLLNELSRTPLVNRSAIHEYTMGALEGALSDLPTYVFPFVKNGTSRAFEAISGNMHPLIKENSLVICEKTRPKKYRKMRYWFLSAEKKAFF